MMIETHTAGVKGGRVCTTDSQKTVSPGTVIHYHANIHKALKYAVKMDLIPFNPADKVERPKKQRYIADYYRQEELERLLEASEDHPYSLPLVSNIREKLLALREQQKENQHDGEYLQSSGLQIKDHFRERYGQCSCASGHQKSGLVSTVLAKKSRQPRKALIYKTFRALPVLTNVQKTAEKELDFPHFSQDQHLAEKKEKSRKPLSLLDFLAERMGFEPMCDCSQTDFEAKK